MSAASAVQREFWVASGHHLLDRSPDGYLVVTDAYLRAYFARPELMPPEDACAVERGVHGLLLREPRTVIADDDIAAMRDADARENWTLVRAFRDALLSRPTLEAVYLDLVRGGMGSTPPIFLAQLTHAIARNVFDGEADAFVLRAAELFFRVQRQSLHAGTILLADDEVIEGIEGSRAASPLMRLLGGEPASEIEVLNAGNAPLYHRRSDGHDFALAFPQRGPERVALAKAMSRFLSHITGIETIIEPVERITTVARAWYVGLDVEGSRIGRAYWTGGDVGGGDADRILALFRLRVLDTDRLLREHRATPIYLILGVGSEGKVRLKVQNLIDNLPIVAAGAA